MADDPLGNIDRPATGVICDTRELMLDQGHRIRPIAKHCG
jgi:hypothetical protein